MQRGRAEAIVDEVRSTVEKWPDFAARARVLDPWREQIRQNLRLSLPPS